WAKSKGYLDHNPLAGYRKPAQTRAQALAREEKGRALSDDEIRKVWEATASLGSFGQLVRLCLLGGARPAQAAPVRGGQRRHGRPHHLRSALDQDGPAPRRAADRLGRRRARGGGRI